MKKNIMVHSYKANAYAILKLGGVPVEIQEDTIFHCKTDLLTIDININLKYFEENIDGEWIGLDVLKKRRII